MTTLQTLERGIDALGLISEAPEGLTVARIADALGVHRAIAYRIVATLEARGLVTRGGDGRVMIGGGLMRLAGSFEPQFRAAARPLLVELARETRATSCIAVAEGAECVVLMVEEAGEGFLRVAYRLGSRHPLTRGATGIAILSGRPPRPDDTAEVIRAREDGYSITSGQLQRGAKGVASPILRPESPRLPLEPCVAVVSIDELDVPVATAAVQHCAERLRDRFCA